LEQPFSPSAGPITRALERLGGFLFAWRNLLFPVILGLVLGLSRPVPLLGNPHLDPWLDLVGLGLIALGQCVRIAVTGYDVGIKRGGKNKQVYSPRLVTDGFFRHMRNPLYTGNLLIMFGFVLMHNGPLAYLVVLPLAVMAYSAIVANEEAYLVRQFGEEYQEYRRQVPRWNILPCGLRSTLSGMSFNARRALMQEHTTAYSLAVGLLALFSERLWSFGTPQERHRGLTILLGLFLVASLAWGVVRYLKKTRRLRSRTVPAE
jgi:protein-S-isoprenylcysteine O-methyltransferase Ste14